MKKALRIMLASVLSASLLFAGCAKAPKTEQPASKEQTKTNKVKVGFIFSGPITDKGYVHAHNLGREAIEKELKVETIYKESVKEDKAEIKAVIDNFVQQGCTVIFGTSFGYMDGMEAGAKEYPNVKFLHSAGYKSNGTNFINYFGKMEEPRYLTGIAAGMKTKSNKIGFVAAHPVAEVIRGIDAFTLGVRSVNPNAVVKVVWTNTWNDPAKEKEAAKALVDQGCDVIAQHQNSPSAQQAAEEKGVFSVGYNLDMTDAAPKAVMTGAVWNWGALYVSQVKAIMDGTWKAQNVLVGMESKLVDISPITANAPAGAKEKIEKAKADIISGKLKIFAGPIKDQTGAVKIPEGKVFTDEEVLKIEWFVEGVEGTTKK